MTEIRFAGSYFFSSQTLKISPAALIFALQIQLTESLKCQNFLACGGQNPDFSRDLNILENLVIKVWLGFYRGGGIITNTTVLIRWGKTGYLALSTGRALSIFLIARHVRPIASPLADPGQHWTDAGQNIADHVR